MVDARRRHSTGNRITFSSWIEEILGDYVRDPLLMKRAMEHPESLDYSDFE